MMYSKKFVSAIKVGGKIVREFKDKVVVPFGSEYSILLKNLENRRAMVSVFIDGAEMASGLVVDARSEMELERSIVSGNLNQGNRFKFIERTESIENHRGIGATDGLIEVRFAYEYKPPVYAPYNDWNKKIGSADPYNPWQLTAPPSWTTWSNTAPPGIAVYSSATATDSAQGILRSAASVSSPTVDSATKISTQGFINDAGITVPGSISNQEFKTVSWFPVEAEESMVFHIVGFIDETPVEKPILVASKPKCQTCGRTNKSSAKFCGNCGTSLLVLA